MTETFDAIVIGAGQSGPSLAVRLAAAGRRVALVERSHLGGTCVNDGCTPTKTLVASARVAHMARQAAAYGVTVPAPVTVDMRAVKARVDGVVGASLTSLSDWLGGTPGLTLVWGAARFEGPHAVRVGERLLEAAQIFINAGAHPTVPDWPGLADVTALTNTTIVALDVLPEHLVIVGGSYIGLEFAQIYRRFGAAVTVIEGAPRIIAREDEDVSAAVAAVLEREGIVIHTNVSQIALHGTAGGLTLSGRQGGQELSVAASHLLVAVGRTPNTADLDLHKAGVATDARGYITVDDTLCTTVPHIWALGDINGRGAFTHTSYNDYEIVAANLLDHETRRVSDRITAYALYTDPPLARIGASKKELLASGQKAKVGHMPMSRVGRARERGEVDGFMEVYVDADDERILGATLFGIEADEAVHLLLDTMYARAPYTVIQRAVHIHPTVSELIPTLLGSLEPLQP